MLIFNFKTVVKIVDKNLVQFKANFGQFIFTHY